MVSRLVRRLVLVLCAVAACVAAPADGADDVPRTAQAAVWEDDGAADPTVPPPPTTPPPPPKKIGLQQQIYIASGVLSAFLLVMMVIGLLAAFFTLRLRQRLSDIESGAASMGKPLPPRQPTGQRAVPGLAREPIPQRGRPSRQGKDNRAFAGDDEEDDFSGDEIQGRGYSEFPADRTRNVQAQPVRPGRAESAPGRSYDRFHQPMPDQYLPSEDRRVQREDSNSRYGAGNLARLPKGPAPQPHGYDRGYADNRSSRSPAYAQW